MKRRLALGLTVLTLVSGVGFIVPTQAQAQTTSASVHLVAAKKKCHKVTVPPKWPWYMCINFTPGLSNKNCYSTYKTVC